MDNIENKTPVQPDLSELQAQCDSLQSLLVSILVLVIVISGTFNLYLLRQVKYTRTDLAGIRPQATQIINNYNKTGGPLMADFVKRITEYGRTHADFAPIMAKYNLKPGASASATPTAPSTASAPAPAAKK